MVEKAFVVFTDGGCEPNPGRAGAGFILKDADGTQVAAMGFYLGDGRTCNEAEYSGLLHAVEAAVERGATRLDIFSDSVLLVRQVEGRWKLKAANLQEYYQQIMECLGRIASWRIQWVPGK